LGYYFLAAEEDLQRAANSFKTISSNEAITGCVACIDGFLLRVKVPPAAHVGHVKSFFPVAIKPTESMYRQHVILTVVSLRYVLHPPEVPTMLRHIKRATWLH
jgi:hypothetical protein